MLFTWGSHAHGQVLRFGGQNSFLCSQGFCSVSGHNKVFGGYATCGYGAEGSSDDQSVSKGIVKNDEKLYPHCQLG